MLSFKDGKAMKPMYDYYVETDLDTVDDQPIDYSKRYDDQLADDVCGSSSKKRHLSTPSESAVPNKIPGDELKVYCIEGTPLIISSASSLCDLHEIGALLQATESEPLKEDAGQQPCFQEPSSNPSEETSLNTKCDESHEDTKFELDQCESTESTRQENISGTDENFSKASSPLMFSRSSSICSLNSFEQHSIVDDRSSVSMFSNLASGIISPSDIPDSPGEAMSPFTHKRHSEFVFPPSDHQTKSMDPALGKLNMNANPPFIDEAFDEIPEDNLKVYNDEGDCCSVSNLSALSIQTNSLNRVSVAVFHKSSFPVVEHKSSIRISCSIVTGNAELQSIEENSDAALVSATEPVKNCTKSFSNYSISESKMMDDDLEQDEKINFSSLAAAEEECKDETDSPLGAFSFEDDFEPCLGSFPKPIEEDNFLQENESPDYSKDNSDDECDALLEECIKSGMPTNDMPVHQLSKEPSNDSSVSKQEPKPKKEIQEQNISHSDCDTSNSEEEDFLLQSCIQLGMPPKSSNPSIKDPVPSEDANIHSKSSNSPDNSPRNFAKEENMMEVSDDDDDEYEPLLQHMIQMGKSKEITNSYSSGHLDLGYRDNRPDGTSDEEDDDDDDILTECIQAGMPKPEMDQSKRPYTLPAKTPCVKSQPHLHRLSPLSNTRAACVSSFPSPHQPSTKSPTREYRTVHQYRKSPTKDRAMPLPSYNRPPHKRSPTAAEDRAVLLSSLGGQSNRKSPARSMPLLSNALQRRKSPSTPDRILPSNFVNQPRRIASSEGYQRRYQNWIHDFREPKIEPAPIPDATCIYRTEDTPILSPSVSMSDLSTLSFSEDRLYLDCSLNNSRNSDCSSESEEDELLRQCIRSGMPSERRALA